jgi:hypothetical protein
MRVYSPHYCFNPCHVSSREVNDSHRY